MSTDTQKSAGGMTGGRRMTVKRIDTHLQDTRYTHGDHIKGWDCNTEEGMSPWCFVKTIDDAHELALRYGFEGVSL